MDVCSTIPRFKLEDVVTAILVFGLPGGFLLSWIYGNEIWETYSTTWVVRTIAAVVFGSVIALFIISGIGEFIAGMDPSEIISKCRISSHMSEEEKLIKAYKLATDRAYALWVNFLIYWILIGIANSVLLIYGIPHWLTTVSIYAFSLFGFLSFVLWIISYLRYRDYSKRLLAIQLKKSDKAEISIKI